MSAALKLTSADWQAIEREACKRSLATFVRQAWPHIIPDRLQWNWHIEAIAEHLEAVARGEITRLLVNVPPGTSKSTIIGVMYPAWLWGPGGQPWHRYIGASHEQGLAVRDNRLMRELVTSEWYQSLWPTKLQGDQNEKLYFENEHRGFRQACAVASMTGRRGHTVAWDDPLSPEKAHSDLSRETAIRVLRETVPTRLNDPATSAIVIVMQRLHENDPAGYILANDLGYEHLLIPMEFEPDRRVVTSIGWTDPRKEDGELLDPKRFPPEVIERDKKIMGSYAWAGQMQQRPAPREGGMFKRGWFEVVDAAPASRRKVRRWDFAATEGAGDWTVGLLMSEAGGVYYVEDVARAQLSPAGVERLLINTAKQDGKAVKVRIPQDPGAAGKSTAAHQIKLLAGWDVRASPETGSKEVRANPVAAQAEAGNVKLVRGAWLDSFLEEACIAKGSKIRTIGGDISIEDVRRGDTVTTRNGERKVLVAMMTNARATLWEIKTSTGQVLRATSNHPIFVQGSGFMKVEHLRVGDVLLRCIEGTPTTSTLTARKSISQGCVTGNTSSFTGRYGRLKSGQYLTGFISTTKTKILQTTRWTILSLSRLANTLQNIGFGIGQRAFIASTARFAEANTRQRSRGGAGRAPLGVGTSSKQLRATSSYMSGGVSIAVQSSGLQSQRLGFAASNAQARLSEQRSLESKSAAIGAEADLKPCEQRPSFAADAVVVSIRKLPGEHPVFNLEVERDHEYFAEGLLVHNCMFPFGANDDQVDALSGAFAELVTGSTYSLAGAL